MSDRDTFGPRLRRERERRAISLDTIADVTNVSMDLWQGLERNDFSRWPTGIFARAFVRDYAKAVGLDADEIVDEFCRLFPIGDRRANRVLREQAALIGHPTEYRDDPRLLPPEGDRRAASREAREQAWSRRMRLAPRAVAAIVDSAAIVSAAAILALATPASYWPSLAVITLVYYAASTVAVGSSPGALLVAALRQRKPALFAVQDRRRAHA